MRPRITIEKTPFDRTIETISLLILLVLWGLSVYVYMHAPTTIPIHFGGSGKPDGFGNRATLFILPILGTAFFFGMSWLSKSPHLYNYGMTITEANAERAYTVGSRMMRMLTMVVLLIFLMIVFFTHLTITGKTSGLGTWFLPVVLVMVFIPTIYFLAMHRKA